MSASRPQIPDRVFQDPGIGEVAGVHNVTFPDPDDLDGRRVNGRPVVVTVPFVRISVITTSGSWVW